MGYFQVGMQLSSRVFAQHAQSLGFDLQLCIKLMAQIYDPITQEVKAEGSEINSYLWLHSKFEAKQPNKQSWDAQLL